jgi:F420H(2)-dependent quinone reductase
MSVKRREHAMSTQKRPRRPLSRRIQARVMGIVNVPMRRVLALPFATPLGNRLMLVYLTGRKTGRSYRQPVSYVRDGENLLTPGGGNWKLNLVEGQPVRIRLRGRDVLARPEIISNTDDVERLLGVMIEANPTAGRFVRVPTGPDGRFDHEKLEAALRYGFRIIRWHLEEPGAPASSSPAPNTAAVER